MSVCLQPLADAASGPDSADGVCVSQHLAREDSADTLKAMRSWECNDAEAAAGFSSSWSTKQKCTNRLVISPRVEATPRMLQGVPLAGGFLPVEYLLAEG